MLFETNEKKVKSDKNEDNIWVETRARNEVFYTKTYSQNFDSGKAVGGSVALTTRVVLSLATVETKTLSVFTQGQGHRSADKQISIPWHSEVRLYFLLLIDCL